MTVRPCGAKALQGFSFYVSNYIVTLRKRGLTRMQAREQLDRVRKIVLDAKKLKKRREQLVASGTSLVEIDAEIERN